MPVLYIFNIKKYPAINNQIRQSELNQTHMSFSHNRAKHLYLLSLKLFFSRCLLKLLTNYKMDHILNAKYLPSQI